jgi:hypothetical protein
MKKIITLSYMLTVFVITSFGQCIPDSAHLSQNQLFYPNSLPGILQNSSYSGVLSFEVPNSVPGSDFNNPLIAFFTISIDSVQITSVTGAPAGVNASVSPALGTWIPASGFSCILFSGTTTAPIGNYPLTVSGVGCGHFMIPVLGAVDSCMPINFSSIYPYDLQVCDTQCTNSYDTTYATICRGDSLKWGNIYARRTGRYVDTALQSIGCDSLHILFVTNLNPAISRDSAFGCRSANFAGNVYTIDTTINTSFPSAAANGCDSLVFTNVVVGGTSPTITVSSTALTAVDPGGISYQWLQNGAPISGATSGNYSPTGPTVSSYSVVVTDRYGCIDTSAITMVSGITGIAVQNIKLYPNPNNGSFIMETHGARGTAYKITNTLGQVVEQNIINSDQQAIDLGNVPTGVYTLCMKGIDPIQFTVAK